ncbi:MAG: N-acetyltransferase [Thermodesulfobacteriota bacterium]
MVRKAKIQDVRSIHKILTYYANQALLLPRSLYELYDHLRDFYVAEEEGGGILGTCTLCISWEDLGEIRSLAVVEETQRRGIGSQLVEACLSEAGNLGLPRVFVLTMTREFFARFGFQDIEKSELPQKIWADCIKCPKFPDCDELAMILELKNRDSS